MRYFLVIIFILFSLSVNGEEVQCKKIESKGEGHWPLPDKAFTRERANEALDKLTKFTNDGSMGADYVSAENELMFLKGYMLKTFQAPSDKIMMEEYCKFLETEAYVRH